MAKVDSVSVQYKGRTFTFEVHFAKSSLFYIRDVPGDIIEFGAFENRNETLHGCINAFRTAVKKAEDYAQKVNKVILVDFTIASQMIGTPTADGRGQSINTRDPLYRFCADFNSRMPGYGFTIDYRVVLEVTNGEERRYYRLGTQDTTYARGALHVNKSETPIPFSPEAVESLERIKGSLKEMVVNISGFFKDADTLGAALESGFLKLN